MKKIIVYGCSKNPSRKDLVRRAAVYFLNVLLPRKRSIQISIHVQNELKEKECIYGECYHIEKSPSKYKIRLDNCQDDYTLIETLAHEFVHVRQFDKGELALMHSRNRWKGQYYSDDEFGVTEEPWEVEPRERESALATELFNL